MNYEILNNCIIYYNRAEDEHGNPVKRTKSQYPYSYDGFVTWRAKGKVLKSETVYSDRLLQWGHEKYNTLSKKHFGNEGQYFFDRSPKRIQSFLRDYLDAPDLKLVMEYCNVSSGYPLWRFDFISNK